MARGTRQLLTGGSGLLALNWALACHRSSEVFLGLHTRKISPTFAATVPLSFNSLRDLQALLSEISPDLVVNTTAITNIEYCEANPKHAYGANVIFAENLACACSQLLIPLVHISTDHLFSGNFSMSTESCPLHPINVYAETKAEAEQKVLTAYPNALVIRTNFYGWGTSYRSSITDQIINTLKDGHIFNAFHDVFFTPILVNDLVDAVFELLALGASGIFNVVSDERISKYQFASSLVEVFGLPSSLLKSISINDMPLLVRRPRDMSLSNQKTCNCLGHSLGSVESGLHRLLDQSIQCYQKELQQL